MQLFYQMVLASNNVVEFSAEGVLTDINQNLLDLWEMPKEMFVGKHYSELVGEEAYRTVWADMEKGVLHHDVRPVSTASGKTMVFKHHFLPIFDYNKNQLLRVMLLAFLDETEEIRKKNEEMKILHEVIKNEKFELKAVMDAIDNEFVRVTYDVNMNMTDLNDYTLKMFGYPREQLIGSKITAKMPPEEVADFTKNWKEMLNGKIIKGEGDRVTASGVRHIWYMYTPVKDSSGKTCKVMMIGQVIDNNK